MAFGSRTESVWAGGVSGVPGSPYYFNILPYWLSNNTLPTMLKPSEVTALAVWVIRFEPCVVLDGRGMTPGHRGWA